MRLSFRCAFASARFSGAIPATVKAKRHASGCLAAGMTAGLLSLRSCVGSFSIQPVKRIGKLEVVVFLTFLGMNDRFADAALGVVVVQMSRQRSFTAFGRPFRVVLFLFGQVGHGAVG